MPTFHVCGDPHGEFAHIVVAARDERPAAIILLGDLDLKSPLEQALSGIPDSTEVFWIPGNHDTDNDVSYDNLFASAHAAGNLHTRVLTVGGVRIAGLGGVFRGKVWNGLYAPYASPDDYTSRCGKGNLWRGGLPLKHRSTIFPSDIEAFAGLSADILVTHEAPDAHRLGSRVIGKLAASLGVKHALHGHHHESIAYPDGVWRGVALREIFRLHI